MKQLNQVETVLRQEILARKLASAEQLDGELSISFLNNCHSKVNEYLSLVRPEAVDDAYNRVLRVHAGKQELERIKAKEFWKTARTAVGTAEYEASIAAVQQFILAYPSFDGKVQENRDSIINLIEQRQQVINSDSLRSAYETLASEGKLYLFVDGEIESIRGKKLTSRSDFWKYLQPVKVLSASETEAEYIKCLSADEFKKQRMLPDDTLPPVIQQRIERDVKSFLHSHPELQPSTKTKQIIMDRIAANNWVVSHDSMQAAYAECQQELRAANCIVSEGTSIPVRYGSSTLTDHRKPSISPVVREITLDPNPTPKRVDMDKLLALPADEFQRVVNGTPGLRELLDGDKD